MLLENVTTPSMDEIITQCHGMNLGSNEIKFAVVDGSVGTHNVVIMMSREENTGMAVRIRCFCINVKDIPTTTERDTTIETTVLPTKEPTEEPTKEPTEEPTEPTVEPTTVSDSKEDMIKKWILTY